MAKKKPKRGRPPGSKNKKRGRPPGSKNKRAPAARKPAKRAGRLRLAATARSSTRDMLTAEAYGKLLGTLSHLALSLRRLTLATEVAQGLDLATARALAAEDAAPASRPPVEGAIAVPARRGRPPKAAATLKSAPAPEAVPAAQETAAPADTPTAPELAETSPV